MQVTVENPGGLQRRLTVQMPASEVQEQIDARLREIGKTARLKGFRPGRVPMKVLKQRYGPSVQQEVVTKAMESSLMQAIRQESLQPASRPVIESISDINPEQDIEFTAMLEVYPEFGAIDVGSLAIKRPETEVTDEDVDNMLETLRQQRADWVAVSRAAGKGDQVLIEYAADTADGRVPQEGMARLAVTLGESGFDSLEKALEGVVAGGVNDTKLTFPENFPEQALAGKEASLSLKVDSVREQQVPELDEEFVKSFSIESGDMDEMRAEVRNNLDRELKGARLTFLKTQLVRALLEAHEDAEVPEALVRQEAAQLLQNDARKRGEEPDPSQLERYLDVARRRVKSGLLMSEIARQNDILVDGAKVRQAIETVASTYEQSREVVQMYYNNPDLLQAIEGSVLEEQVVDWVLDNAKVSAEPMAFNELIGAAASSRQGL